MSTVESTTASQVPVPAGTWNVDPIHSSIEFHVKHLGIVTVKGVFTDFQGSLHVAPDGASAEGSVKVASVDTREDKRDGHLRSPDFFDAEQFPEITFESTSITSTGGDEFQVVGDFTIHGVTHTLTLSATLEGAETDHEGKERVGLSANGQINRTDYGMTFNMALGSGNVVVGEKVKILLEISAVKAA
jgi:polyisoprenoid-binding protein YceI